MIWARLDRRLRWPSSMRWKMVAAGSPRYAQELDIPGLRSRTVRRFPYLLFYVERVADIDIWRAVCAARDIPGWMREPRGLT